MPELWIVLVLVFVVAVALAGIGLVVRTRRPRPYKRPPGRDVEVRRKAPAPGAQATVEAPPAEEALREVVRPSLRERLAKSRKFLAERLSDAFVRSPDEETWEDIEAALIQADTGVGIATRITADLKEKARERRVKDPEDLKALLAEELVTVFDPARDRALSFAPDGTTVWLVVGVNGTGKTTTIGKLATDLRDRGRKVALAAADTFRAAADEQLGIWGERSGAHVVRHQPGADPGAVAFDAFQHASARDYDVLIVDTAGRLHTKAPLMDELAKIRRVIEKNGAVQEVLLVIDATAGQNGLVQAKEFTDKLGVTGV
ncbi:MAG TPA: signaling recognition particle receptor family protein, partial [Actinomycetota bacterium]|nr:signaling recognition particle receptor family protein [Actinomycetota bacterium]